MVREVEDFYSLHNFFLLFVSVSPPSPATSVSFLFGQGWGVITKKEGLGVGDVCWMVGLLMEGDELAWIMG